MLCTFHLRSQEVAYTISTVVSSLGRPNVDGDEEDFSWIVRDSISSNAHKNLLIYQRTDPAGPNYIDTNNGNECLTYVKYIIDHYHSLPE